MTSSADRSVFSAATVPLSGKNLIEASAGTGKTHAITTLFLRFLIEKRFDASQIAVLTFTEAATAELRDRIRGRLLQAHAAFDEHARGTAGNELGDPVLSALVAGSQGVTADARRLRSALENVDEAPIATIHGFCQRVLRDNALGTRIAFEAELVPDLDELRDDVLYDFWHREVAPSSDGVARQLKAVGMDPQRLRQVIDEVRRNPHATPVPSSQSPPGGALISAFEAARAAYRDLGSLMSFVEERCKLTAIGDKADRARLYNSVDALFRGNELYAPKHAERLFPAHLCASAKGKDVTNGALPAFFAAFEHFVGLCRELPLAIQHELLRQAPAELERRKEQHGVLAFEDLLQRLARAVRGSAGQPLARALRRRFKAVLVDEFQDTDPVQFEIFQTVFGGGDHPLFLIGDPKQAIYGFRGADVFTYLGAAEQARQYSMQTNWRSDPALIGAVNRLFERDAAFLIPEIRYSPVQARCGASDGICASDGALLPAFDLLMLTRGEDRKPMGRARALRDVARIVAADLVELLSGGAAIRRGGRLERVVESDVAVLTRTNDQCFEVQEALRARGIHSVVIGDKSVFESEEANDLQLLLGGVLDPTSSEEVKRALTTRILGLSGDEIARLDRDAQGSYEWTARFRLWHGLWVERGFMRMFRHLLDTTNAAERVLAVRGGERSLTNLLHLGELLHQAAVSHHLGPAALVRFLSMQRSESAERAEHAEIRLESDANAVRILTVHKSKGLEFPIVYCPHLWSASGRRKTPGPVLFHDLERRALLDIDVVEERRRAHLERAQWESLAEELRVVYVALTRAKHRCTVVWGNFKDMGSCAAASLLHPLQEFGGALLPPSDRLHERSDASLLTELERLQVAGSSSFAVRTLPRDHDSAAYEPLRRPEPELLPRSVAVAVRDWQRTESFSSLIKKRADTLSDLAEGRDHDEHMRSEAPAAKVQPAFLPGLRESIGLLGFPRGRRTGDFFHELLEHLDFSCAPDELVRDIAKRKLEAFGLTRGADERARAQLAEQVVAAVRATLDARLPPTDAFCLRDVPAAERLAELEFRMPVGLSGAAESERTRLTRQRLARAFREHPSEGAPKSYAARIDKLGFPALRGFVKGYVDLVFHRDQQWFVVDYKTNHLGDFLDDYRRERLVQEMVDSHYLLQAHLYAVALDRHLRCWQPGYDYARHFGGILYLFIKGLGGRAGAPSGVYFEKPPLERMQALSEALAGATA